MKEIMKKIIEFSDERGRAAFHNDKDLTLAISLEAIELLENFV